MNIKRFIIAPVVFALGWLSFGIGSALSRVNQKVMSRNAVISEILNLGPAKSGDRWYYMVTCTGQCEKASVSVWDKSGSPDLYVARAELPLMGIQRGCRNCNCKKTQARRDKECKLSSLVSSSFGITVHAETYLSQATLKVEAGNLEGVKVITIHSKSWNSFNQGEIRNFNVTCNGDCEDVSVYVRGTSPKEPNGRPLITLARQIPDLFLAYRLSYLGRTGQDCEHCFCQSRGYDIANTCEVTGLTKKSFVVSVSSDRSISKNVELSVVGLGVEGMKEL